MASSAHGSTRNILPTMNDGGVKRAADEKPLQSASSNSENISSSRGGSEGLNSVRGEMMQQRGMMRIPIPKLPPNYWGPEPPFPVENLERAVKWHFDPLESKWASTCIIIKVDKRPFAEGAMKYAFKLLDLSEPSEEREYVMKMPKEAGPQNSNGDEIEDSLWEDAQVQSVAKLWAEKFNESRVPKKIDFLVCFVLQLIDRPGEPLVTVEKFVKGEYVKWSNNWEFTDDRRNTPHAFSHFTYEASAHRLVVTDVQGVGDVYTDPQIHSIDGSFGNGNLGMTGMDAFCRGHKCNALCRDLGLPALGDRYKPDGQGTCAAPDNFKDNGYGRRDAIRQHEIRRYAPSKAPPVFAQDPAPRAVPIGNFHQNGSSDHPAGNLSNMNANVSQNTSGPSQPTQLVSRAHANGQRTSAQPSHPAPTNNIYAAPAVAGVASPAYHIRSGLDAYRSTSPVTSRLDNLILQTAQQQQQQLVQSSHQPQHRASNAITSRPSATPNRPTSGHSSIQLSSTSSFNYSRTPSAEISHHTSQPTPHHHSSHASQAAQKTAGGSPWLSSRLDPPRFSSNIGGGGSGGTASGYLASGSSDVIGGAQSAYSRYPAPRQSQFPTQDRYAQMRTENY